MNKNAIITILNTQTHTHIYLYMYIYVVDSINIDMVAVNYAANYLILRPID